MDNWSVCYDTCNEKRKKVVLIQRVFTHYRKNFIDILRKEMTERGIEFIFIYGQCARGERKRKDNAEVQWGKKVKNIYIPLGFVWQPVLKECLDADLVIVEQANRLLVNYLLILAKYFSRTKVAFWGHGKCHQKKENSLFNSFKKLYTNKADWWFAYTEDVAKWLVRRGMDGKKITAVQNAIDTNEIQRMKDNIAEKEKQKCRKALGIEQNSLVGIFCGGLYKEKQIPFLMQAAIKIMHKIKKFHFIIIGGGPDSAIVTSVSGNNNRIHYLGPKFGREKILYMSLSDIILMPGLVGLVVLDSFAMGLPLVTTNFPYHSPEISYIENGVDGIITEYEIDCYADAVIELLKNQELRKTIAQRSILKSKKYTVENMAQNFTTGILQALDS